MSRVAVLHLPMTCLTAVLWLATGKWTVQQAAEMSVAAPTIEASLDARFLSGLKEERVAAAEFFHSKGLKAPSPAEVFGSLES